VTAELRLVEIWYHAAQLSCTMARTGNFYYGQEFVEWQEVLDPTRDACIASYTICAKVASASPSHAHNGGRFIIKVEAPNKERADGKESEPLPNSHVTGLTTIWPSEQLLTIFCLEQPTQIFKDKLVFEVAAGFHGLAGFMVAKYQAAKHVFVSDASVPAVECLARTIKANGLTDACSASVVDVTSIETASCLAGQRADVVLASDCFLFDEVQPGLAKFLDDCLADDGIAFVTAPPRNGTLRKFLNNARAWYGFSVSLYWHRPSMTRQRRPHSQYNADIHLPMMAVLRRPLAFTELNVAGFCISKATKMSKPLRQVS
jgi:predicted nicotinamide N-methyase